MAYKALYRTYRPQTFDEVAGQKHIVKTLKNALENNKVAHAYLFCGPRGTGKTTMAKLLAKALNCEQGIGHQCNECESCKEIINGSHPDVIEIDAASNNGVEQVRDLINKVNYLPIEGRYQVYIIDEVHMMTTSAFNALLKTLEEPPAHVIFILATTEPHNILPTILSRCQRYDFTKVSDADIANRLEIVLQSEGIEYEDEALNAIISLADGGMRDALSILDQVLAYSGNTLNEDDVYTLFGLTSKEEKIDLLKSILQNDASRCLKLINGFFIGGVDLKRLNLDLLNILKDVLILKITNDDNELMLLSEKDAIELGNYLSIKSCNDMMSILLKTQNDFKYVDNVKTLFEVTILKLCSVGVEEQKDEQIKEEVVISKPKTNKKEIVQLKKEEKVQQTIVKEDAPSIPAWMLEESNSPAIELENDGELYQLDNDTILKLMTGGNKELRTSLGNKWSELTNLVINKKYSNIASLLRDGKPIIATKDVLILEYNFDRLVKKTNIKSNQKYLREVVNKLAGIDVFIYGISRSEKVGLIYTFQNLRQIGKLPDPKELEKINFKEMK